MGSRYTHCNSYPDTLFQRHSLCEPSFPAFRLLEQQTAKHENFSRNPVLGEGKAEAGCQKEEELAPQEHTLIFWLWFHLFYKTSKSDYRKHRKQLGVFFSLLWLNVNKFIFLHQLAFFFFFKELAV